MKDEIANQRKSCKLRFMELQLIELYSRVCSVYDKHPGLKYQRLSNNWQPNFTDQELITVYLFGQLQGHFKQNRIHQYICQHFRDWFPDLPAYQSFNNRLNNLAESLPVIVYELFEEINGSGKYHFEEDCLIDSMPIMLAVRGRSYRAKVARGRGCSKLLFDQRDLVSRSQIASGCEKTKQKFAETGNNTNSKQ